MYSVTGQSCKVTTYNQATGAARFRVATGQLEPAIRHNWSLTALRSQPLTPLQPDIANGMPYPKV